MVEEEDGSDGVLRHYVANGTSTARNLIASGDIVHQWSDLTLADRPAMSAFQVDGKSNTPPIPDWRLFCFDECFNVALSDLPSSGPRPEYKKGAKQFHRIDAEL